MTKRAVFLDRDGVINRALVVNGHPLPPKHVDDVEILAGVPLALERLKEINLETIVVTNQPDIARGSTTSADVAKINARLLAELSIDAIYVCPHDSSDRCECRKPLPGLLKMAALDRSIDLKASYMVGDRWRDIEAGEAAGCTTLFVDYRYDEPMQAVPNYTVTSLLDAAAIITDLELRKTQ